MKRAMAAKKKDPAMDPETDAAPLTTSPGLELDVGLAVEVESPGLELDVGLAVEVEGRAAVRVGPTVDVAAVVATTAKVVVPSTEVDVGIMYQLGTAEAGISYLGALQLSVMHSSLSRIFHPA
jgi:hypothetical protein